MSAQEAPAALMSVLEERVNAVEQELRSTAAAAAAAAVEAMVERKREKLPAVTAVGPGAACQCSKQVLHLVREQEQLEAQLLEATAAREELKQMVRQSSTQIERINQQILKINSEQMADDEVVSRVVLKIANEQLIDLRPRQAAPSVNVPGLAIEVLKEFKKQNLVLAGQQASQADELSRHAEWQSEQQEQSQRIAQQQWREEETLRRQSESEVWDQAEAQRRSAEAEALSKNFVQSRELGDKGLPTASSLAATQGEMMDRHEPASGSPAMKPQATAREAPPSRSLVPAPITPPS